MPSIKLHLETAEYDAIARYAGTLKTNPESVAYAALNRLMLETARPEVGLDIVETAAWRSENLPLWADSAGSIHAYESKADEGPTPSRYF